MVSPKKQTRVLLIQPDYPKDYSFGPKNAILFPALGLECIAANILDLADVRIFDYRILRKNDLINELNDFKPNYVGISCNFSTQIYHVYALANLAKSYGAKTVIGGWHPTLVPDETISFPGVDIIIRGEGELTFRELIAKNSPIGVKGLSYKINGKITHNPSRELSNLNSIAPPARYLRPLRLRKSYNFFGLPADLMETSRGCPFNCKFCSIHVFYQKKYRVKKIKNIIKEMNEIREFSQFLYIIDDNFMVYNEHVKNLCDAIIKSKLNMFFMTTARIDMVNKYPETFEKMAKAGFIFLFLGIESFSNRALKSLNKQIKFDEIKRGIKILHDLGFIIQGNVILGADFNDTIKDIESTIEYTKLLDIDLPTFSLLTLYPQTELRNEIEKNGMLLNKNWKNYTWFTPLVKYTNLTPDQMSELITKAYSETRFFNSPSKKVRQILKARGLSFFLTRMIYYKSIKNSLITVNNIFKRIVRREI
ncbi:MAG: B12-binding domain-containing radical SAM protein [Candidatus Helarchaeota archaeon]